MISLTLYNTGNTNRWFDMVWLSCSSHFCLISVAWCGSRSERRVLGRWAIFEKLRFHYLPLTVASLHPQIKCARNLMQKVPRCSSVEGGYLDSICFTLYCNVIDLPTRTWTIANSCANHRKTGWNSSDLAPTRLHARQDSSWLAAKASLEGEASHWITKDHGTVDID